jgi:hypothetical protein
MLSRKPYFCAALLWLAMVMVFFWPVIFQGKVIAPLDIMESLLRPWATTEKIEVNNAFTYDAISQYLPYDWSVFQSLRQDGYIGWNPYTHSGSSIVENTMICPGDWHHHLYRFLPFWTAWNTGIILQFALAGIGLLLLLRDQKIPAAYALIGVVAFGFYSQFILWINHRWVLGAMCWAPWILWALLRARKSGRIIDLPSIAFIALAFRGGHLQSCVFVVLLVGFIALAEWWQRPEKWRLKGFVLLLLPYAVSGIFGAILSLDVFTETVPALLHGKREMNGRSWADGLFALPTLVTSVFPSVMGTPQGLDLMKIFRVDLFSIKFIGALALLLGALGFYRRRAPLTAKVLFAAGLLLPFTPADQWLYSRFTVVFALGGAWLAAWYLTSISDEPPSKVWKRAAVLLALVVGVWLAGSVLVAAKQTMLEAKLHEVVLAKLPPGKESRVDWMMSRADVFLKDSLIWAPSNLAMLSLLGVGLFACSRVHHQSANASRFALLVALCAFGEMFLFSSTWVTFSAKPAGDGLYVQPAWVGRLKHALGNGTVHLLDRSDFDYMQLNTPSAYGIRFADGYETVTPRRIDPAAGDSRDPARCAASGISHLLISREKDPGSIPGWERHIDSAEFVLYRNPQFESIYTAKLASGETLPLFANITTPNRRELNFPSGVTNVTLMESFNPGWEYSVDGGAWKPVHETALHAIRVDLNPTVDEGRSRLILQYRPVFQRYYRPIIAFTLAGLLGFSIYRSRRMSCATAVMPQEVPVP